MKASINIVIDEAMEDEVILYLNLLKIGEFTDRVPLSDVMVCFNPKLMRANAKLPKRDHECMHQVPKGVKRLNNKVVFQFHEVLCTKGHLGGQPNWLADLGNLIIHFLDILCNNPIQVLLGWQELFRGIKRISKRGEAVHRDTNQLREMAFVNQQRAQPEVLVIAMT